MTLKQIDERLHLFPEYLRYLLEAKYGKVIHLELHKAYSIDDTLRSFKESGFLIIDSDSNTVEDMLMTYDQWLHQNGHEDLIEYPKQYIDTADCSRGDFVWNKDRSGVLWRPNQEDGRFLLYNPPTDK